MSTSLLLSKILAQSFITVVSWVSQLCPFLNACCLSDRSLYSTRWTMISEHTIIIFACIYMARRYYYFAEKHYRMLFQKKTLIVGNVFLRINTAQSINNYQIWETKSKYIEYIALWPSITVVELNSVSSQCARGKSSLARKAEVHVKFFQW